MKVKIVALAVSALLFVPIQVLAGSLNWESSFDYFVTNDDPFLGKDVEPTIAVQANNPNNVVAGNFAFFSNNCQIYRSTNGGTGWSHVTDFSKHGFGDVLFDPVVTSANNGNFYYVCAGDTGPAQYIRLGTSTNGGATWSFSDAVSETTTILDKPWITADDWSGSPYVNNVYLCWTEFPSSQVKVKRIVPFDSDFSAVTLGTGLGCNIAVGPNGQIYVAYATSFGLNNGGEVRMRRNLSGGSPSAWSTEYVIGGYTSIPSSENCTYLGNTYECVDGFNGVNFRVVHNPSIAVDSKGGVHASWFTYSGSSTLSNIVYTNSNSCKSSSDSCTGWNAPVRVNLDTGARDQWNPALTVSKQSDVVHIVSYDRRDDSTNWFYRTYDYHCHYYLPVTNCRSASQWSNTQITSTGTSNLDQAAFIDDYHGIATSTSREAYTDWTDHRETSANDYDIWSNRSQKGFEIIATEQSTGNPITGLNVVVLNPSGVQVANGFTPFYYSPTTTGIHTVRFNNYGSYYVTTIPSTQYTTDYNVYSWGAEAKINVASTNNQYNINGIYYNHGNPGNYARITFQSTYTNGVTLNGMGSATRDSTGTYLTKGFTPFTVGLPTNQNLITSWNNWSTYYYQYGDTTATELSDVKASWGGEQTIQMNTNGAIYTDTGRYLSCGSPC